MKKRILGISLVVVGLGLIIGGALYIKNLRSDILGLGVVTDFSSSLSSSITSSQNTLTLSSVADRAGNTITFTSSTFGDAVFFNIEPGTSRSEIVRCTGLSGSQFTGCTRGLPFGANGCNNTASTTLQQAHNAGVRVVMSNVCQIYNEIVAKDINQTMRGQLTVQYGGIVLGTNSATTTNQSIVFDADTDFIIRGNRSSGILEYSEDGGASFSRFGSTSSIADAGRGILRLSGTGATTTVFHLSTSSRSGLEFYNRTGNAVDNASVRVAVSSTQGLWIDNSSGGLLAVTSTWLVGGSTQAAELLGFASTSFIIDADNPSGSAQTVGITFETGTGNSSIDKWLYVDSSDFSLKFGNRDGSGTQTTIVSGGASAATSTAARSFNAGVAHQNATNGASTLLVTHNLGIIPQFIRIYATVRGTDCTGGSNLCNGLASSSMSYGVWVNGAAPTVTPGANSSTYVTGMGGWTGSGGSASSSVQSTTSTIFLRLDDGAGAGSYGENPVAAKGVVGEVTSSTFRIFFTELNTSDPALGPVFIQWESGQ